MKTVFLKWIWVMMFAVTPAFGGEGATTVGDGGHVVVCRTSTGGLKGQLLDLFEAEVLGYKADFDLGTEQAGLMDKVRIGLERMQPRLKLSAEEVAQLLSAAERFMRFPYDPWKNAKNGGAVYIIKARDPLVNRRVQTEFARRNCYLDTIVIHPDPENPDRIQRKMYEHICMANVNGIKNCFLTNTRYLKAMNQNEKACLILHETLRFLPKGKKFSNDAYLRRNTVYACTGK